MKTPEKITSSVIAATLLIVLVGCGESKSQAAAKEKERQRIELEKQAQADAAKANKAITTNNQKMFSRMNSSGPGAQAPESATPTSPENPPNKK